LSPLSTVSQRKYFIVELSAVDTGYGSTTEARRPVTHETFGHSRFRIEANALLRGPGAVLLVLLFIELHVRRIDQVVERCLLLCLVQEPNLVFLAVHELRHF